MSVDGIVTYELTDSTVNGKKFFNYLRGILIPEMMPYNGSNPKFILVMDN